MAGSGRMSDIPPWGLADAMKKGTLTGAFNFYH
jgi:hypothetical protein